MKTFFLRLPLLLLSLAATREVRGEFDPAVIAADSRWVVYADLNALRDSPVGKQLVAAVNRMQIQAAMSPVRVDVPKVLAAVGSITAYGANFSKDPKLLDGTLVIQGTPELRKIAEALLIEANLAHPESVAEVKDLGYDAYALSPPGGKPGPHVVIAFPPEPIVLVSKSEDQVRRARELFQGRGQSLAQNAASPLNALLGNSAHATLFAASLVPSDQLFSENAPQARMLHLTTSGSVALGEDAAKTFAHVQLVASSDEMADKLQKILQGMAAMMSLGESSDQQLTEFLNSAVVARQDRTVTLQLAYSSERLAQMLQHQMEVSGPHHTVRKVSATWGLELSHEDQPASPHRSIGKVVSTWTLTAPATDGPPVHIAAWFKVEDVALLNGSAITFETAGSSLRGPVDFDQVRIVAKGASAGAAAPLVFSRKFMTELRAEKGTERRYFQFYFPGESGTYTLEAHLIPPLQGKASVSVGVMNPAAPSSPAAEPAHDKDSGTISRP